MLKRIKKSIIQNVEIVQFTSLSVLGSGLTALLPLIVAKLLNPSGFGIYSLSTSIIFFFSALFISSTQAPLIIEISKEYENDKKINKSFTILLFITIISIIISAIIFYIFRNQITNFTNADSKIIIYSLFFAFLGYSFKSIAQTILLGLNQKKKYATLDAIFGISSIIMLIILYIYKINNIYLYINIYLISGVLALIYGSFFIKKEILRPLVWDKIKFQEIFKFIRWQIIGLIAIYFVNWGDNFILRFYVNIEQIGIYNLSYKLFNGMIMIIYLINSYFLPYLSKNIKDKNNLYKYIKIDRPKLFLILITGIILSVVLVPLFIYSIYGSIYYKSIFIYMILSLGLIPFSYLVFYIPLFNSLNKYKIIQISAIIQIFINISLDIILIPIIDIYGAAIATVVGYTSIFFIYEIYYHKKIKNHYIETIT